MTVEQPERACPTSRRRWATHFPDQKLVVVWSALQYAHRTVSGLLEAAGALKPNPVDVSTSTCYTRLENCDLPSLHVLVSAEQLASPKLPPEPDLPVPPHLADRVSVNAGDRLPTTPA